MPAYPAISEPISIPAYVPGSLTGALAAMPATMDVSGSGSALNDLVIPSTDVSSYKWFAIHTMGTFVATLLLECSNDNTNWVSASGVSVGATSSVVGLTSTGTPNIIHGPTPYKFFRARISAYTSGTVNATVHFSTLTDTGITPVATSNPAALADTFTNPTTTHAAADLMTYNGTNWDRARGSIANGLQVDVTRQPGYSNSHISTNTTTTVKSGAGMIHAITINTKGLTNTATVYDNTTGSGTVIAVIDTTINVGTLILDASFATGLTVVTAGGTAADITVSYR